VEERWPFWGRRAVAAVAPGPGGAFTAATAYAPRVDDQYPGISRGEFDQLPVAFILHGSRSTQRLNTTHQEYEGTARYAVNEPDGFGWNATVGEDEIAVHMPWTQWGWHARRQSTRMIGLEFAQPNLGDPISDAQVRAAAWGILEARRATQERFGEPVPFTFYTHAEVEAFGWTGMHDGKTDTHSFPDKRGAEDLKSRILQRLRALGQPV